MQITRWQYVQRQYPHARSRYDAWTQFTLSNGTTITVPCQIPYDKVRLYAESKGWRIMDGRG